MDDAPETLVVQAEIAELARVNDWLDVLAERLRWPARTSYAIRLCLEESVSNIARHAFDDREGEPLLDGPARDRPARDKEVRLTIEHDGPAITATIEDHGAAFDPLGVAIPARSATIDEAQVGGLGVHLMRRFAQHLAYERRDGVNRMTMRFDLPNGDAPSSQ